MTTQYLSAICPECGFPISGNPGQTTTCPNCGLSGTISEGVEIPNFLFWGGLGILVGVILAKSKTIGGQLSKL